MLPKDVTKEFFDRYKERLPKEWGISLFPTKFNEHGQQIGGGNTFHEHVNRPPKLAGGVFGAPGSDVRCGDILAAFWNPRMHRVELIQTVWERKLPHVVRMIDEGFLPGISMACDVPFDRCTVCGNLAINDFTYCQHLQRSNGLRGKLIGDTIAAMINDFPLLFDSSIVAHPAAVEGRTLRKIAHMKVNPLAEAKQTVVRQTQKEANVNPVKQPSQLVAKQATLFSELRKNTVDFPNYVLDFLGKQGIIKSACLLADVGISFTGSEIGQLLFPASKTASLSGLIADSVHASVLWQKAPLVLADPTKLTKNPAFAGEGGLSKAASINPTAINQTMRVVGPWISQRSYAPAIMSSRVVEQKPARLIDLNQPLAHLSDETKAILLTRILSDEQIVAHLHNVLVKPLIMWELQKLDLANLVATHAPIHTPEHAGVLGEMHSSYVNDLGLARAKFYASQPGNA
jgi:hypothetical protein